MPAPESATDTLRVSPDHKAKGHFVGRQHNPVMVIDNLFANPEVLVDLAKTEPAFAPVQDDFYPGVRKKLPDWFDTTVLPLLAPYIQKLFKLGDEDFTVGNSCFSIVTHRPEDLVFPQVIPHFDTHDPRQFAFVYYLSDGGQGGTSIYRHRRTGTETMSPDKVQPYFAAVEQDVKTHGMPPRTYITGSTPMYEQLATVDAQFNRLVLYQSCLLHSGNITNPDALTGDVDTGRLTITAFVKY